MLLTITLFIYIIFIIDFNFSDKNGFINSSVKYKCHDGR